MAFEREYSLLENDFKRAELESAKTLTKELLEMIDSRSDCPKTVKTKARNILNSQLKSFSPSLKEKIVSLYEKFVEYAKPITEQKDHDVYGISKFYSGEEFKKKISKFVDIRNKVSLAGIIWNDGAEIFSHLKLPIYFSVLNRVGFSSEDSSMMLSWLFARDF